MELRPNCEEDHFMSYFGKYLLPIIGGGAILKIQCENNSNSYLEIYVLLRCRNIWNCNP